MSEFRHYFKPGTKDIRRCSYKITIINPDGEKEIRSCAETRDSFAHIEENDIMKWKYIKVAGK